MRSRNGEVTRYVGTCQICDDECKITGPTGAVVLHGYKRPGGGRLSGKCPGTDRPPYELSCNQIKAEIIKEKDSIVEFKQQLVDLRTPGKVTEIKVRTGQYETKVMHRSKMLEHMWLRLFSEELYRTEQNIRFAEAEVVRLAKRVANWRLKPVKEIDEQVETAAKRSEISAKQAVRKQSQDEKAAKRTAADNKRLERERLQQEVVSSYRTRFNELLAQPVTEQVRAKALAVAKEIKSGKNQKFGYWHVSDAISYSDILKLGLAVNDPECGRINYVEF